MAKRRLATKIKAQVARYSIYSHDKDGWSPTFVKKFDIYREIVPPEFRNDKRRFLGYTTIFEAMAVAHKTDRNRVIILYQSELHPLATQGRQNAWFGRFHLFRTKTASTKMAEDVHYSEIASSDLPQGAVRARLIGLYRPARRFASEVNDIFDGVKGIDVTGNPDGVFDEIKDKQGNRLSRRAAAGAEVIQRNVHAKFVELIRQQGYFTYDEIADVKPGQTVSRKPPGSADASVGTVEVERINLGGLEHSHAVTRAVNTNGTYSQGATSVAYYQGKPGLAGFTIILGVKTLRERFVTLLEILHHESQHLLQNLIIRRWVDEWRAGNRTQKIEEFVRGEIEKKRPNYDLSRYHNLSKFIHDPTPSDARAMIELRPYFEQLSLALLVGQWARKRRELIASIDVQYFAVVDENDPSYLAMLADWAPGFRRRFNALESVRQDAVRKLLEGFGEKDGGAVFADRLLGVLDGSIP